jgi:hypothetical protein
MTKIFYSTSDVSYKTTLERGAAQLTRLLDQGRLHHSTELHRKLLGSLSWLLRHSCGG